MQRGKIKWFNEEEGFGFIGVQGQKDVWFGLRDRLEVEYVPNPDRSIEPIELNRQRDDSPLVFKGREVLFDWGHNHKGVKAANWWDVYSYDMAKLQSRLAKGPIFRRHDVRAHEDGYWPMWTRILWEGAQGMIELDLVPNHPDLQEEWDDKIGGITIRTGLGTGYDSDHATQLPVDQVQEMRRHLPAETVTFLLGDNFLNIIPPARLEDATARRRRETEYVVCNEEDPEDPYDYVAIEPVSGITLADAVRWLAKRDQKH